MTVDLIVALLVVSSLGVLAGSWVTNQRWVSNAKAPFRLSYRGRLYKVEDVTPWDKPTRIGGNRAPQSPRPGD